MRIGVVTTSYPRFPGDAAGSFVAGLNRYLLGAGHEVRVVAAGDADGHGEGEVGRVRGGLFYGGGAPDALAGASLRSPRPLAEAAWFSARLLLKVQRDLGGCDALISHWVLPCGVAAALCQAGRRHLAIAHSSDIHLARRLGLLPLVRLVAARARLVYTAESLRVAGAPGEVVPMGIEAGALAPPAGTARAALRRAARQRLGFCAEQEILLFLGRLVPVKGVEVLLDAFARLPRPGCQLVIAGDGPLREALMRRAKALPAAPRVRFLGEVSGERKRDLLWGSDLLVLPSLVLPDGRTEGAPTVLMEALAAGLPAVASDVGGVRAVLGEAGVLLPPGDTGALARALLRALAPDFLDEVRQAACERGRLFDWSEVGPRLLRHLLSA